MKRFLVTCLVFLSGLVSASEFYVGGAISAGRLRYDVDGWVQHQLDKNNLREEIRLFERAGGTVTYEKHLTAPSHKAFIGYQPPGQFSYELAYRYYGPFSLRADANASGELVGWQGTVQGKPAELYVDVYAHEGGEVKADATGFSASVLWHAKPVFFRLGAETIVATVEQVTVEEYGVKVSGSYGGRQAARVYAARKQHTETKREWITLPLIGVGVEYPINSKLSWRAEVEHVGAIKQGFDFYSLSLLYKF
jgi:hypothetical protein